ncbi:MAG: DUF4364 family protein [Clostridia bacterium]
MSTVAITASNNKILIDNTQHKLLLLFVFDKMEMALSDNTIYDFCTSSNTWLNYIDCKIALEELVKAQFIAPMDVHTKELLLYNITPEGRLCLAHFFPKLPSSIREDVAKRVKEQRMAFKRKQEYFSDYSKNRDGTYKVTLKIAEPEQQMIEMIMTVPDRETAKQIYEKWEEKAPQVYQSVYDILVE